MGKLILGILAFAVSANAGDAPKFLSYLELGREAGFKLVDARAEYLIAIDVEQKDIKLYDMKAKLLKSGAVAEQDVREALWKRDVSIAQTRVWRDRIAALEGAVAHSQRNAEMAKADIDEASQIDALYADYLLQWKSQCGVFKSEVELFSAELALADFHLEMARKLRNGSIVTEEELLERQVQFRFADEKLKRSRELEAGCMKSVPTLEEVRKIAEPTQK